MRTITLVLTGAATLGTGLLGGLASNPVPKVPRETDWRARYRTAAASPGPAPVLYADTVWPDAPYGMAGLGRTPLYAPAAPIRPDLGPLPPLERAGGADALLDPRTRPPALTEAGRAAVAAALATTTSVRAEPTLSGSAATPDEDAHLTAAPAPDPVQVAPPRETPGSNDPKAEPSAEPADMADRKNGGMTGTNPG